MAIAFYMVLTWQPMNDIIALKFHISLNATTWIGRIGMLVLPPLVYFIAYRWAVALQRNATARCSSTAWRRASSSACRTAPTSSCTSRWARSTTTATHPAGVPGPALPKRMNKLGSAGKPNRQFLRADPAAEDAALNGRRTPQQRR